MTESRTPEPAAAAPFDAAAVLRWYAAAGVDIAVGEDPVDRTAPPPAPPPPQPRLREEPAAAPAAPRRATALPPEGAATLEELRARLEAFDACLLRRTATRTVFGTGPADARLMVIGEAPGADEDRSGIPFVGRAGQLLDKMLASIGWPREAVYITNVVPWRPPGNRNPTPEEIALCLPFVLRAIDLVAPRAILLLGGSAAAALLDSHDGITRLRGRWHGLSRPGGEIAALPTFHPAFLLRNPSSKAAVWRDLLGLKARIGAAAEPR
ncbi:uracil-DNA glycosylase [Oleispirillum naphthae]|uniref:uracil-DNA glycosylase n=1 Tax=Oleispirillum naphthae TaxID=2838853 RepID=UPI00308264D6